MHSSSLRAAPPAAPLTAAPPAAPPAARLAAAPPAALLAAALLVSACVNNTPEEDPLAGGEPTLTLTPALPCTDPILPQFSPTGGGQPTTASFEVSLTGVTASASAGLEVELSYEAPRPPACFVSALEQREDGTLNYRCMDVKSAPLRVSARRAYDSLYCVSTGPLAVTASVTLADGTKVKSAPLEMLCQSPERFAASCVPVGAVEDMAAPDLAPPDMAPPDMEVTPLPSEWSVVYTPAEEAPLQLAVQGSTSGEPTSGTYSFRVINQRGEPISGAQTRFFLNWSPASDYPVCGAPCAELGEEECGARAACLWTAGAGAEAGAEAGVEVGAGAGSGVTVGVGAAAGSCGRDPEWRGGDERCDSLRARCEANLCLPTSNSGGDRLITPLPVSISPLVVSSDDDGYARVSLVAQEEPGVFSVRAESTLGARTLTAVTPSITVTHRVPTQRSFALSCAPSVAPAFSRRLVPNEALGTDALGYLPYQRPIASCAATLSDRYNGAVSASSIFFMSEAGGVSQTADEALAAALSAGRPSPVDLAPCGPASGCGATEPVASVTLPGISGFNPRDALNRVIAVTVGEAEFIDLAPDQARGVSDVGVYQPSSDFVPPHSEPYVDANDNGRRDPGEAYFDANRNGDWDADVFGRLDAETAEEDLVTLGCVEASLRAGALLDEVRCDGDIDPREFMEQNPVSLRAHIWSSDLVLQVGLMQEGVPPVVQCGSACATSAEAFNAPECPEVPPGLSVYLNAWRGGSAAVVLTVRDDNLNCVGLAGVSFNASLEGVLEPYPAPLSANLLSLSYGASTPSRESCFDEEAPLQPRARSYVAGFAPSERPQEGDEPSFTVSYFTFKVRTPDYSEGEGDGEREVTLRLSVGVCH